MARQGVVESDKCVRTGRKLKVMVVLEGMGSATGSTVIQVQVKDVTPLAR